VIRWSARKAASSAPWQRFNWHDDRPVAGHDKVENNGHRTLQLTRDCEIGLNVIQWL
jgi:hypothetical protein